MTKRCAVVTYIYPQSTKYWNEFIDSLEKQTFREFDLFIFSDGVNKNILDLSSINYNFIYLEGTPVEIRNKSFLFLKNSDYDHFIFLDSDDTMSNNRIEVTLEKLKDFDFVTCDLNLTNKFGNIIEYQVWKNRLGDNFQFDYQFIKEKNIAGFGCSALNKNLLNTSITIKGTPIAADWYLFYLLLHTNNTKCLFTSECQVNYRQHSDNEIGLKALTAEKFEHIKQVRKMHFNALHKGGMDIPKKDESKLKWNKKYLKNDNNSSLFWWEIPD